MTTIHSKSLKERSLCCPCQEQSNNDLRCPYKKECYHSVYHTLENDLKRFVDKNIPLPLGMNMECVDDGSGVVRTLLKNEAKYHNGFEDASTHILSSEN